MLWTEVLVEAYGDDGTATWIVDNRHTLPTPMVNPDGNHQNSRWNGELVKINRDVPAGWAGVEHAFLNVERYGAHLEVVQADVTTADAGAQVDVAVANDGYGSALWVGVTVAAGDGAQDTLCFQDVPANGTVEGRATLDAGADALATGLDVTSGTPSGTSPNPSPRRTTRAPGAYPPSSCWARSRPRRPPSASRAVPEGT